MNDFQGRKVKSNRYGDGIIQSQNKHQLTINFPKDRIRVLDYPDCFERGIIELVKSNDDGGGNISGNNT